MQQSEWEEEKQKITGFLREQEAEKKLEEEFISERRREEVT